MSVDATMQPMVGTVTPGFGDFSRIVGSSLWQRYLEETNLDLVPGSLNVALPVVPDLLWSREFPDGAPIPHIVRMARCTIGRKYPGFVVHWAAPARPHPDSVLEIVGAVHFRTALALRDGAQVHLELPLASTI